MVANLGFLKYIILTNEEYFVILCFNSAKTIKSISIMSNLRILYVASEINPFLQTSEVADFVRQLPQAMQEKGMEIRILVPRFGLINERKNRLHEVVRLSGINISVGDEEKPLVIKVASIPNAKLQVYFIDNEDYFHRKSVFHDKENKFFEDNDERAIFFCKGVIETVKKLGWAPDIVHCNDWMTSLIPLYLKTTYKNDPLFKETKSIFNVHNNSFTHKFGGDLIEKVKMLDIDDSMLANLETKDYEGFVKLGIQFSDLIIGPEGENSLGDLLNGAKNDNRIEVVEPGDDLSESYYNLYNELAG